MTPQFSQTNAAGMTAVFSASVNGSAPLAFQWLFNGTNLTDNAQITGSQCNALTIASVTIGNSGAYQVVVTNAYGSISAIATLTVIPAIPIITWSNPAPIPYGMALTSNQLNATANVPGSFVCNPTNGAVLNAGANTLSVIFTPSDPVNYSSATDTVSLFVSAAPLTVTTADASRQLGETNPVFIGTIAGLTNGDNITATYATTATSNSPAGSYPIVPTLEDPGGVLGNYTLTTSNGTLTIAAPPAVSIAWLRSTLDPVDFAPTNTTSLFSATGVVTTWTNMTGDANTEFYLQDATAGIAVRWSSAPASNDLPPAGSIVQVTAPLADGNGLLELAPDFSNPLHSVTVLGLTNLPAPQILPFDPNITGNPAIMVQQLQGSYFVASNVFLDVSTGPDFAGNTSEPLTNADNLVFELDFFDPTNFDGGLNYTVSATNQNGETFMMYYNDHTDIVGQAKPAGPLTIYGVLGQFVTNAPYTSGYKFIPSRLADIVPAAASPIAPVATMGLAGISPALGPAGGGTAAAILGTNFVDGASVSFGLLPAASVAVNNGGNITAITPPQGAGAVNVIVTNGDGQVVVLTNAFLYGIPPCIMIQPVSQTGVVAGNVTLSLAAGGSAPLNCQWLCNGNNLPNATNPVLLLTNLQAASAGFYTAVVSNLFGVATSSLCPVSVLNVPVSFAADSAAIVNGQFSVTLTNLTGQGAVVFMVSTDLVQWIPIQTNPPAFGQIPFTDALANASGRFYKAVIMPPPP